MALPLHLTSAGRLLQIRQRSLSAPPGLRGHDVWAYVLATRISNELDLWRRLIWLMEIPYCVERDMQRVPNINPGIYLTWVDPFRQVVGDSALLRSSPNHLFEKLDRQSMSLVEICHNTLAAFCPDGIDPAVLKQARNDVEELASAIRSLGLNDHLQQTLLDLCDLLDRGLCDALFMGRSSVQAATQGAFGVFILKSNVCHEVPPEIKGRIWSCLSKMLNILQIVDISLSLPEKVKSLFE